MATEIRPLICLDIGHGVDTYPPSKGIGDFAEFSFNNAVGKIAKDLAEINGFDVYLSQPFDSKNVDLNERIANINRAKPVLGVSIHANAGVSSASGHEFWHWHSSDQSRKLASIMDANAIALLPNKRRGLRQSEPRENVNFGILRATNMPFVIGEFGFFTNPEDLELLKSPDFHYQCAKVIVKSICDYLGRSFKLFPDSENKQTIQIQSWKVTPLKALNEAGIVNDFHGWVTKLDEPAPNWLVFAMTNRLLEEIKKLQK